MTDDNRPMHIRPAAELWQELRDAGFDKMPLPTMLPRDHHAQLAAKELFRRGDRHPPPGHSRPRKYDCRGNIDWCAGQTDYLADPETLEIVPTNGIPLCMSCLREVRHLRTLKRS